MKRRFVVAGALLVVVVAGIFIAVKRPRASAPHEPAPRPVVHEQPAAPAKVAEVASAVSTSAVSMSAVPAYVRPVVVTPGLASLVDRSLPFEERVRGLTSGQVTEVKDGRDLEALAQLLGDPAEDDTVRHEIASLLSRSGYAPLEGRLFKIVENPAENERIRSWAIQHLGNTLNDTHYPGDRLVLADRMRGLLTDRHRYVQRMAIQALVQHNDPAVLAKVREMISDPAPEADAMRDMAMRCALEKNWRETLPAIRVYLRSTNESVRISAIWVLGKFGDEESRPVFDEAASSSRPRIQSAGKLALANLNASAGKK
jgi:HEAT repeat protein